MEPDDEDPDDELLAACPPEELPEPAPALLRDSPDPPDDPLLPDEELSEDELPEPLLAFSFAPLSLAPLSFDPPSLAPFSAATVEPLRLSVR